MKYIKQMMVAIGAFLILSPAFAAPITPAQIGNAQSARTLQKAWITGSSSMIDIIYQGWVLGCDINTNSIFSSQTGTQVIPSSMGSFNAYACYRGGQASVLFHTVDGDSINAFAPHTIGTKLARVSLSDIIAAPTTTLTYFDTRNPANNAAVYKGIRLVGAALPRTGATAASNAANAAAVAGDPNGPQLPVGGFSDIESALFPAALGGGSVSSKGAEFQANIGHVFGVAVSTNLYRAMQVAQGITAADANFDPALAPSIASSEYAAIIDNDNASAYKQDWSLLAGAAGTGKKVIVASSTPGSIVTASNVFFLKNPCTDGVAGSLSPATALDSTTTFTVVESSDTAGIKRQLTSANTAGNFAIGVMSLENDWSLESATASPLTNGYRWLKIDDIYPETVTDFKNPLAGRGNARLSAVKGKYLFHMETRYFVANTAAGTGAFGANIVQTIATKLGNPPTAAACNTVPRGLTLNPAGGSACTVGTVVHKGTNSGNNCAPTKLFF